ncbi:Protein of unknown function [Flavobacterium aquidurense]|uniref:DUF3667 domain-containing protein n=1 Tax=Flavobacterium frigidimaris TaxID=262320 RepID=A0ABX4BUV9_FLAFR|nr:DUF3667 domain-containing protein [Flavobacterium frigidimaris]OXA81677.1 hypothetical protein B0A65_02775 [Flavobacterium frigidimaris]SDZ54046.1 Protein of unknown function [Flavobacterium aquidurense]
MEINCKNCHQVFTGHYCNNCGQPADTHKINAHFLWHDIQHGLLHFDAGIPYSLKQLFTRPGHTIREFIEGKRVKHFKPLSLVAVLGAFYGFLFHYYHIDLFPKDTDSGVDLHDFGEWTANHFAWTTIATIPIYTIGTYIAFRKQGYNFFEFFVLNTFKASQRLFVQILTFPILLYLNSTHHGEKFTTITYIIGLLLIFWTNVQFFNKMSKTKAFFLTILSHIIFWICFLIILITALAIMGKLPK